LIQIDDKPNSFIKTYKHKDLNEKSLTGSFIRPMHIKNFKFCDVSFENYQIRNNSIDFQADLIVYPMLMDTKSQSTKLWLGNISLGGDAALKTAF